MTISKRHHGVELPVVLGRLYMHGTPRDLSKHRIVIASWEGWCPYCKRWFYHPFATSSRGYKMAKANPKGRHRLHDCPLARGHYIEVARTSGELAGDGV